MFVLSRRLAQPRVALLATALLACSAFQVWYAQEVRMYALVTLAVLIAVYALVPAWQQGGVGAWVVCSGALLAALYLDYSAFYVYSALVIWFVVVGRRRAPTAPFMPTQACGMTNCVVWWWKVISRSDEPAGSAWMGHGKSDTSARTASAVASVSEGMTCRSNQPRNTPAADDKLGQLEDLERPVVLAGEDRSRGGRSGADPQGRGYLAGLTTMRSPSPARARSRGSRTHTVFLRCSYDFL
jgi:Dolichyl-phosphate-mannose-protein mannosyltransferase